MSADIDKHNGTGPGEPRPGARQPPDVRLDYIGPEAPPAPSLAARLLEEDEERWAIIMADEQADSLPPELRPLLARLRTLGPRDGRPVAEVAGEIKSTAVAIRALYRGWREEQRRGDLVAHVDELREKVLDGPDAVDALIKAADAVERAHAPPPPDPLAAARFTTMEVPATVEPKAWTFRPFQWIPGRPAMFLGYPQSGKTFALLAALSALSVGRPVWGLGELQALDPETRSPRPLRCLFLDLEAGGNAVKNRLDRFDRGMGITREEKEAARIAIALRRGVPIADVDAPLVGYGLADVDAGALILGERFPSPADLAKFRAAWTRLAAGFDIVAIDPFKDLAPGADENDARIGNVARELGGASRESGAAFVAIHHDGRADTKGKPGEKKPGRPSQYGGRGSSALDAKAGSQLRHVLAADRSSGATVTMIRDNDPDDGQSLPPLLLTLRRNIGEIELTARRLEEGEQGASETKAAAVEPRVPAFSGSADVDAARDVLRRNPGCAGKHELVNKIVDATEKRRRRDGGPIGRNRARDAVDILDARGEIEDRGTKKPKRPRLYWHDPTPPPTPQQKAEADAAVAERAMTAPIPPEPPLVLTPEQEAAVVEALATE